MTKRDSRYWRARAEGARTRADSFHSADAKQTTEDIAHGYDAMADRAEKREKTVDSDSN